MALYVAAFPELGPHTHWIKEFRARHDPTSSCVEPHLTLVFPTETFSSENMHQALSQSAKGFAPFRVVLRSALIMPENASSPKHAHIFLVPDEGLSQFVRLHDRAYAGELNSELRLDIPFIPHLTIGSGIELQLAKVLVDELNSRSFQIEFDLKELFVVEMKEDQKDRLLFPPILLG